MDLSRRRSVAVDSMIHLVVSSGMSRMIRAPESRMSRPVVNLATRKRSHLFRRSRLRLLPYRR